MIQIAADADALKVHGLTLDMQPGAKIAKVTLQQKDNSGNPVVVPCEVAGDKLNLFPERASLHRKLLAEMGQPFEMPQT